MQQNYNISEEETVQLILSQQSQSKFHANGIVIVNDYSVYTESALKPFVNKYDDYIVISDDDYDEAQSLISAITKVLRTNNSNARYYLFANHKITHSSLD